MHLARHGSLEVRGADHLIRRVIPMKQSAEHALNILAKTTLSTFVNRYTISDFKSTGRLGTVDKINVILIWALF